MPIQSSSAYIATTREMKLMSTLTKCEKINIGKLGKSQQTLLERRTDALKVALALIEKEQERL